VRELLTEVRAAGHKSLAAGKPAVEVRHLASTAGMEFIAEPPPDHPSICAGGGTPNKELIEKALKRTSGNVSAAARLLGMHRTQLKRIMDRLAIDGNRFTSGVPRQEE
jgi:transcriptional regulator with GAF, ATPase, and Fis domain